MAIGAEDIKFLYRAILNRDADDAGLRHYCDLANRLDLDNPFQISKYIVQSTEFRKLHGFPINLENGTSINVDFRKIIANRCDPKWIEDTLEFYRQVQSSKIDSAELERNYNSKQIPLSEYYTMHSCRFLELFGWLKGEIVRRSLKKTKVLEIGTSAHTTSLYNSMLGAELNTVCRPPEVSQGPTPDWAKAMGSSRHWTLDLNKIEQSDKVLADIPADGYDFIICCEVVEHLVVDPSAVLRKFLPKLKSGGVFFLSTPNYFRPGYLEKAASGFNPSLDFREYSNNIHAHHHFREYTPLELANSVTAAGGKVEKIVFSKCWDPLAGDLPAEIAQRDNLIILVAK